jgi:putative transposase
MRAGAVCPATARAPCCVIEILAQLVSVHGAPAYLRSDNGPEFVATAILRWLSTAQIETALIDPG